MCGIFGYTGKNVNAFQTVLEGLRVLEYRGYDSFGIAFRPKNAKSLSVIKKTGKIPGKISNPGETSFALGHTRWATHGGVTVANAHPHVGCKKDIALIHNGIIENYTFLRGKLEKGGHKFKSQTDSEVGLHLIEEIAASNPRQSLFSSVKSAFRMFEGLNAIIVMDAKNGSLIAAKNGSPLVVGKGKDGNLIASDAHALVGYCNRVYYLEDNEFAEITGDEISVYDGKGKKDITYTVLSWEKNVAEKGRFPHFMLKEIYDQPKIIGEVSTREKEIKKLTGLIRSSYGTYLVGCGTAAYACLLGTYLFSKVAKRHVNFTVGSEFSALLDFITPKSLVIALSQSGETIDVIDSVKKAKEKGAKIASLVNVEGSTLYRLSEECILLGAGTEKAVVSTKAFVAKLAMLVMASYSLAGKTGEGKKLLAKARFSTENILQKKSTDKIKLLAKSLAEAGDIYIIGRGMSYPIALETALKIKEASYIHAEGFAAGELKHGVIALIEKGTPCIAFVPDDEMYAENLAGAMEMKARGGRIIGISPMPNEVFDFHISYHDCGNASVIPAAVIGQLIGYYLAVSRDNNPDMPRNLAKSVTVK